MSKTFVVLLMTVGVIFIVSCAVRRPLFSPHRSNSPDHRQATTIAECLDCHTPDTIPHAATRGDCFKCHRLERGK